jgi:CRP-like cAMP-binding protein
VRHPHKEARDRMEPARLERLPLFAELDAEQRAEVASCVRDVDVVAGATLATQGENAYEFFVIEEGEAEVRRGGEVIALLRQGDVFGEIGLLVTGTRTASVVAVTPMKLVAMFSREFQRIQDRMPAVADTLRATMRDRVARTPLDRRPAESDVAGSGEPRATG